MLRPIGAWRSANHHNVVLENWARRRGLDLGVHGYKGWALFVRIEAEGPAFVVEHRGPGAPPFGRAWPFGAQRGSRARAFREALACFRQMSAAQC